MKHAVPHLCQVCGGKLKPLERAEQFCDACLRKAQLAPILKHDREGVR